ncbi:hypothetical protein [Streptomyces sp. NPDC052496]|uniref:hypothetical protein n=1 Tax=Streptomyces sp. NPDC052496 TaxID=3154951 RepID=UPI0034206472
MAEQLAGQARREQAQWVRQERRRLYGEINLSVTVSPTAMVGPEQVHRLSDFPAVCRDVLLCDGGS